MTRFPEAYAAVEPTRRDMKVFQYQHLHIRFFLYDRGNGRNFAILNVDIPPFKMVPFAGRGDNSGGFKQYVHLRNF
jgi:hypothetical protein